MILRICPYQILKHKHCSHFSENNFKHCKLANLACKNSCNKKSYHSIFNAINTKMIYPSALCSWFFFNMYTRCRINNTQIYTFICEECAFWVTTFLN